MISANRRCHHSGSNLESQRNGRTLLRLLRHKVIRHRPFGKHSIACVWLGGLWIAQFPTTPTFLVDTAIVEPAIINSFAMAIFRTTDEKQKTVRSFILKAWTVFICTRLRLRSQAIPHLWMFSGIQRTPNVATLFSGCLKCCAWSCCFHIATGCGWRCHGQSVRYVRRWAFEFPKGYSGNSRWLVALNFANGQAYRQTDFYQHGTSLSTG